MRSGVLLSLLATLLLLLSLCASCDAHGTASSTTYDKFTRLLYGDGGFEQLTWTDTECATCTMSISVLDYSTQEDPQQAAVIVDQFCDMIGKAGYPSIAKECKAAWALFGPTVIQMLEDHYTGDDICQHIGVCHKHSTCRLGPVVPPKPLVDNGDEDVGDGPVYYKWQHQRVPGPASPMHLLSPLAALGIVWPWDKVIDHYPAEDLDGDHFSTMSTLRGSSWRGKDCDDARPNVYPGRRPKAHDDDHLDTNCNGIFGVDANGTPYEDQLCGNSNPYSVIVLGDSASAHFHLPYNITTPEEWGFVAENEVDFPQCSWSTGHLPTAECPDAAGLPMDSVYLRVRQQNRCSHRQYQNISVNGARCTSMVRDILNTTSLHGANDIPSLVFYALVGNDVCNRHYNTTSSMTTPQEFEEKVTEALQWLDKNIAPKSHIVFMGLEHGGMWEIMSNVVHPSVGTTYAAMWNFIGCLEISPCWGWLNPDPTWRNITTAWAATLDAVYTKIIGEQKYNNFDMTYLDNPDSRIRQDWINAGKDPKELLEWVGGGHPSQVIHVLTAQYLWNQLAKLNPSPLPPVNPNNAQIEQLFGDQGGY